MSARGERGECMECVECVENVQSFNVHSFIPYFLPYLNTANPLLVSDSTFTRTSLFF